MLGTNIFARWIPDLNTPDSVFTSKTGAPLSTATKNGSIVVEAKSVCCAISFTSTFIK